MAEPPPEGSEPVVKFGAACDPFFDGDRVAHVVFPYAIDFEISLGHPFEANPELFDDAP